MTLGEGIEQLYVFVVFFAVGLFLAAIYLFALGLFKSKLSGFIFDAFFSAGALLLLWKCNLEVNNGEFRLFVFIGLFFGIAACYLTCKTLLDNASKALYNFFTTKLAEKDNGTHILQQKNIDNVRGGNARVAVAGMHAANHAHSDGVDEPTRKRFRRSYKKSKSRRNRQTRTDRIYENRRIRNEMGGTNGQDT